MRGNVHLLISPYLDGRKQFVSFERYESICEVIKVRVLQDSVFEPFLLLIYINDLKNVTSLSIHNFADDQSCAKPPQKTYT